MLVSGLANSLGNAGLMVENIEMPWSKNRNYDVNVHAAEIEVESAISRLRAAGAEKVFIAGHSQGGAFALHLAGNLPVSGIICIAPGGNVGSSIFQEKLGDSMDKARRLVDEGKGSQKTTLSDYEGKKGVFKIYAVPEVYLTWFDKEGAMNTRLAASSANPQIPILWIVPKNDYPGLKRANIPLFRSLPENRFTRLYEPDTDHRGAPSASSEEIIRWISSILKSS